MYFNNCTINISERERESRQTNYFSSTQNWFLGFSEDFINNIIWHVLQISELGQLDISFNICCRVSLILCTRLAHSHWSRIIETWLSLVH